MKTPVVAIVGRPNVGKSTIFNRIINERVSIVEDTPGVTRDRIYAHANWLGRNFSLIDTGGIQLGNDEFNEEIKAQAEVAIDEADVIVFLTDVTAHLTLMDETIAKMLFKTNKPVILAVNKADNPEQRNDIFDFYSLGLGDPIPISGAHGTGIGDLLDEILPEVANMVGFDQKSPHHNLDLFEHSLKVLENVPKDLPTRLAALFHDTGKPDTFFLDENGHGLSVNF